MSMMWNNLPFDLLSNIFSFLSPDSLAIARTVCRNWHACSNSYPLIPRITNCATKCKALQPWFLALPIRNHRPCCYAHNPVTNNWHELPLEFLPASLVKPIATIGSLILLRITNSTTLQLVLCNPFTRQFRYLPNLNMSRTNPAVGVTLSEYPKNDVLFQFPCFRIYVAGGMSEASSQGGATYNPTSEMYDSTKNNENWEIVGSMPVEFSVRLTVWTPNENVNIKEKLYWITSARAYSVMGFDISNNTWFQLGVPMAERLEFATLVRRSHENLGLVGGTCDGGGCIWELNDDGETWWLVDKVPIELGLRLLSGQRNWDSVKCVGSDGVICLYRDLGSGMVVSRRIGEKGKWEWNWVEGCGYVKGKQVHNCSIRGTLIHPTLASSVIF
ncbi:F-box/kelch-repeat protein At5g15710-like [Arachis stenosperma]|uniref:F-box/kelch-repeat protein At5g15710-like n=1 Tax=Arachis stenosperma TaxID=217475 RepID=UPI0025ABC89F|nr:F-box/kelch-repeat protein At5g15710-like [Arachis stenosperma]